MVTWNRILLFFSGLVGIDLIVLKILNLTNLSWFFVLMPFWLIGIIELGILMVFFVWINYKD